MNRAILWIALIGGLALGFVLGLKLGPDAERPLEPTRNEAGEDLVKRSEFEAELEKLRGDEKTARQSAEAAFGREKAANEEIARLKDELAGLESRLSVKEEVVAQAEDDREARLDRIEKRFRELEGQGIQSLLASNAIGKLIADLRQEGDVGREAVLALLASDSVDDRQLALTLLTQGMADETTIEPIKDVALNDKDEITKRLASRALMMAEGDSVVGALEELVANADDEGVKVNSMYGLLMRGQGVDEALAYFRDDKNSDEMKQALAGGVFLLQNKPEVQPIIDMMVQDSRGSQREGPTIDAAIGYYKRIKTPAAIAALQKLAADPTLGASIKQKAATALQEMGN